MGRDLGGSEKPEQIATHADIPTMRLFRLKQDPQEHPQQDLTVSWEVCTPKSAYAFSAVGYYFGRDLRKALNVAVGVIQSMIGRSYTHTWMPARYLESDPALRPLLNFWDESRQRYAKRLEVYLAQESALKERTIFLSLYPHSPRTSQPMKPKLALRFIIQIGLAIGAHAQSKHDVMLQQIQIVTGGPDS